VVAAASEVVGMGDGVVVLLHLGGELGVIVEGRGLALNLILRDV